MKVKFVPQNVEFEIKPGQSVMHVAQDNGMYIKSVCKGVPSCAECRVRVVDGDFNVLPPGSEELSLIGTGHFIDHRRLSCQLKCFGDITVDMTEQIAKESGLMGGRKSKSRTQKDDRVEDAHAIRLNDAAPAEGGRRERTGGGEPKKKNPLKIGGAKTPPSITDGVSAPVLSAKDIPADVASAPFAPTPAAREPRDQRQPREPRQQREPRAPREPREQREAREPREPRAQNPNQNQNQKPKQQQGGGPQKPKHHVMGEAGGDRESTEALPRAEAIPKPAPISRPGGPAKAQAPVQARDSGRSDEDESDDGSDEESGDATGGEVPRGPRRKRRRGGRGSRGGGGGSPSGGQQGGPVSSGGGAKPSQPAGKPTPKSGGRGPSSSGSSGSSAPGNPS